MQELYDFRFCSGVVREDVGVEVFLGTSRGDAAVRSLNANASDCGVGGVYGTGGAFGITDSLFNLRASVGLTVLAAKPVA